MLSPILSCFLFFGAIMGSAWFGGAISGFVAVVLSSLVVNFFFIPPLFSIAVAKEFRGFLAAFILCAIAIAVVSSARKRAENAARLARDQLEAEGQRTNCRARALQPARSRKANASFAS